MCLLSVIEKEICNKLRIKNLLTSNYISEVVCVVCLQDGLILMMVYFKIIQ